MKEIVDSFLAKSSHMRSFQNATQFDEYHSEQSNLFIEHTVYYMVHFLECLNDFCLLFKLLQMQKAEEEEVGSETEMKIGCLNVIDIVVKLCTDD